MDKRPTAVWLASHVNMNLTASTTIVSIGFSSLSSAVVSAIQGEPRGF